MWPIIPPRVPAVCHDSYSMLCALLFQYLLCNMYYNTLHLKADHSNAKSHTAGTGQRNGKVWKINENVAVYFCFHSFTYFTIIERSWTHGLLLH